MPNFEPIDLYVYEENGTPRKAWTTRPNPDGGYTTRWGAWPSRLLSSHADLGALPTYKVEQRVRQKERKGYQYVPGYEMNFATGEVRRIGAAPQPTPTQTTTPPAHESSALGAWLSREQQDEPLGIF